MEKLIPRYLGGLKVTYENNNIINNTISNVVSRYRLMHPKKLLKLDDNTYYGGKLGEITFTKTSPKKKKPYFVSSRTGLATLGNLLTGIDVTTGPLLHWMQPSQYVGAISDAIEGKNPLTSMLRGNSGVVSEEFEKNNPLLSVALNLGTDVTVPIGVYKAINSKPVRVPAFTFKKHPEVDWSPDNWFKRISGRDSYSLEEANELSLNIPEYREIEKTLFKNGELIADSKGNIIVKNNPEISPLEYIMTKSKNFLKLNEEPVYTGVPKNKVKNFEENASKIESYGTRTNALDVLEYAGEDGQVFKFYYPKETLETKTLDAKGSHWAHLPREEMIKDPTVLKYLNYTLDHLNVDDIVLAVHRHEPRVVKINNVMDTKDGTLLNESIVPQFTPKKSVLGSTGMFNLKDPRLYRIIIPTIFGGTLLKNLNNTKLNFKQGGKIKK